MPRASRAVKCAAAPPRGYRRHTVGRSRRLGARAGKAKAVTATARKLAVLFYNTLRYGMKYADPSADHYEQDYRSRVVHQLHRRARQMGFTFVPAAAESSDAGVS